MSLTRLPRRALGAALPMVLLPVALAAQSDDARRWLDDCRERRWDRDDREVHCELRETRLPVRGTLTIDARENGGIRVVGSDRSDVLVIARVQATAEDRSDAEAMAKEIRVATDGTIRADGPRYGRRSWWSVSYEVHVPRRSNLDLTASNGGIRISDVEGRISMNTDNGGISLSRVAGDVRGETTNGGVTVELAGDRWSGSGLDVRTTNGGITMRIPERYSAELETGTVNGSFNIDFPITLQGRLDRRIRTRLGDGGPMVRVRTTNGGVKLRRG